MIKIKIFTDYQHGNLENKINNFLKLNEIVPNDIQYRVVFDHNQNAILYNCIVIYETNLGTRI